MSDTTPIVFVPGAKFQFTEDLTIENSNPYRHGDATFFPKGLVFSVISLKMSLQSKSVIIRILRHKKLIEKFYKPNGISENRYLSYYRGSHVDEYGYRTIRLYGSEFMTFLRSGKFEAFDDQYAELTKYPTNEE